MPSNVGVKRLFDIIPKRIALSHASKWPSSIALTFDDGPSPTATPRILKTLGIHGVKATFFLLGENVTKFPHLAREIASRGHEIGVHSYAHKDLTTLTTRDACTEIETAGRVIYEHTGIRPRLLRPPFGKWNLRILAYAVCNGMTSVYWSVDPKDWRANDGAQDIVLAVVDALEGGDIVLLHEGSQATVDTLPRLIESLRDSGLRFVTVGEMLRRVSLLL